MASLASWLVGLLPGKNKPKGGSAAPTTAPMPSIAPPAHAEVPDYSGAISAMQPQPAATAPAGGGSADWLAMALAAIGGAPDRNAYTAPFDAAAQRAQSANAQALPQIAAGYDQLRTNLGQDQAGADAAAAQAQQNMGAQQQNTQAQIASMVAPVLAQLAAAGGNAQVGSLTGALQAQVGTGQAQLAQQGAAQTQLSQNLQQAGTQSYNSRVQDTGLAQQAATSNANSNLQQVLNALDARKAEALQQYAGDASAHSSRVAQAKMQAADRAADEPARQLQMERDQLDLENARMDLDERRNGGSTARADAAKQEWTAWHDDLSRTNPVSYDVLYGIMEENDDLATAMAALNKRIANKDVKTKGGHQLDASFLRDRLREAYDIHDRMTEGQKKR